MASITAIEIDLLNALVDNNLKLCPLLHGRKEYIVGNPTLRKPWGAKPRPNVPKKKAKARPAAAPAPEVVDADEELDMVPPPHVYTEDELFAMKMKDLRDVAVVFGVKGRTKQNLIGQILQAQGA